MSRHTVDVSGQRHAVQVYRYAVNLWIADGKVLGQQLRTIGRTAKKAVRAWQNAALQKRCPPSPLSVGSRRSEQLKSSLIISADMAQSE
jgi:hypothetical protein